MYLIRTYKGDLVKADDIEKYYVAKDSNDTTEEGQLLYYLWVDISNKPHPLYQSTDRGFLESMKDKIVDVLKYDILNLDYVAKELGTTAVNEES